MTSPSVIARVREATDLVALIAAYVPLKKQGTRWVGRCCFHEEKTASLGINERQHWHCFGCNQGGDVFEFLMKIESIPFHEALRRLADAAGISLDEQPVTRKQMAYAQQENDCAIWWWNRRRERQMATVYAHMGTEDEEMLEILAMPAMEDNALMLAWSIVALIALPVNCWHWFVPKLIDRYQFQFFRARVTEADRAEFAAEQREAREFAENWLALAKHAR